MANKQAGNVTPAEAQPDQPTPPDVTPAEAQPDQPTPPDVTPAEAQPDQPTPPDVTPAEAQPDQPLIPPPVDFFQLDPGSASDDQIQSAVERRISQVVEKVKSISGYNVVVLYDGRIITRSDANKIYRALSIVDQTRPILLVLRSPGGNISAAYFIGKLCREHTNTAFEVAIPREAKSAATLICCGADEIHMGSLSELGPIDPQFNGMPALAVKHSLEHLAEIASRHPGAKEMISDYLSKSLPVNIVGHFERAAGSAAQYAERLLSNRFPPMNAAANAEIARCLVYDYKDHGFAIDAREAASIFGEAMVKTNTPHYDIANQIYENLDLMEFVVGRRFNRGFAFTGGLSGGCHVYARKESTVVSDKLSTDGGC